MESTRVAFEGSYDSGKGIFLLRDGRLLDVAATGEPLFGNTITDLHMASRAGLDGNALTFGYTLANGVSGVGTVSMMPEPTVAAPVVTSAATASAAVGEPFSYQIAASNTPTSYAVGDLPPGLSVDPATGLITGTPSAAGTFPLALSATNAGGTGTGLLTLTVAPVAVTLAATVPKVTAGSGEVGVFTLSLAAAQDHNVVVSFTVKGTAANGTDYVLLKSTKKIKAGKTSKPIKIIPQGDLGGTSKKTVVLTLLPSEGYTVGTLGKVKVKITAGQ